MYGHGSSCHTPAKLMPKSSWVIIKKTIHIVRCADQTKFCFKNDVWFYLFQDPNQEIIIQIQIRPTTKLTQNQGCDITAFNHFIVCK